MFGVSITARAADAPGAVFALTNATSGNAVVMYARGGDGSLTPAGSFATGGFGSGGGISSQNAIIVRDGQRLVFAVNPGSNSISSFTVRPDGLAGGYGVVRRDESDERLVSAGPSLRPECRRAPQCQRLHRRSKRPDRSDRRRHAAPERREHKSGAGRDQRRRRGIDRDRAGGQPDRRLHNRR